MRRRRERFVVVGTPDVPLVVSSTRESFSEAYVEAAKSGKEEEVAE